MSLLTWDDYESYDEETEQPFIVREITVRVLVPQNASLVSLEDAYHIDFLSGGYIGDPVECPTCDNVRYRLTTVGKHRYKTYRNHYCPHCDGGEDIG